MSVTLGTLRAKTIPHYEGKIISLVICFQRDNQTQVKFFLC